MLMDQMPRLATAIALLALMTSGPAAAQLEITTELEDHPPVAELPGVDVWTVSYFVTPPIEIATGSALSIELPESPGFETPGLFDDPMNGWGVSFFRADPSLGAAAMIDFTAEVDTGSYAGAVWFSLPPDADPAAQQPWTHHAPDFEVVESGVIQVPEPDARSGQAAVGIALLALALARSRRRRAAADIVAVAAALCALPPGAAWSAEIRSPTVHVVELAGLEIAWVAAANRRVGPSEWEYEFDVTVTNTGGPTAPVTLKTWAELSLSPITSGPIDVPALDALAVYPVPAPLVIRQDRRLPLYADEIHWCLASDPPPGLPESDLAVAAVDARITELAIDKENPDWRETVPVPFETDAFDCARSYVWVLQTNRGTIEIRLYHDVAPKHVSTTMLLTRLGFYDGLTFHRVLANFVAQGGDPLGNGRGGPDGSYGGEFGDGVRHHRRGFLSMANAGEGTDGSQFFLLFSPQYHLDFKHTVFGEAFGDLSALDAIEALATPGGTPSQPVIIESATIRVD